MGSTPYEIPSSPVGTVGQITLLLAFAVNAYILFAGIYGHRHARPRVVRSAVFASYSFTALMTLASSLMVYAFVSHDYTIKYVAQTSDMSMSLFYKITAYWGSLDGSLLFWVWVLSLFTAVAVFMNRFRHRDILGYVVSTVAVVAAFFLALIIFDNNPFATFLTEPPNDGRGLNPLLQTYWMVIHPPSLYIGFVGLTIPFAFAVGALASGRLDDTWLYSIRVWILIPWFFLSLGLILGGIWAYEELGWGGYWAWDPVENAGLIPWFTATAFLHSIQIQERRGMFKTWNMTLIIITFIFTIWGTFMTRSGVVQSVHAFGENPKLALMFILFMAAIATVGFGLVVFRLPQLSSAATLESFASREFAFLLNNIVLLVSAFFVLFATMFPSMSEAMIGERVTVGPEFFDKRMPLFGFALLLLTAVGPLLAWRKTTARRLWEQLAFPAALMAVTLAVIALWFPRWTVKGPFLFDWLELPVAWINMGLVALVMGSIFQEFYRGVKARRKQTGTDPLSSLVGLVLAKRRRYGGYVVHLGIALMFFGFSGKALSTDGSFNLDQAPERFRHNGYDFLYEGLTVRNVPPQGKTNRIEYTAKVTVSRHGKELAVMYPARWQYLKGDEQLTTEVALDRNLDKDIYLALGGFSPQTQEVSITVYINPLVNWVWLGFGIMALGIVICLIPERVAAAMRGKRVSPLGKLGETAGMLAILAGVTFGAVEMGRAQTPEPVVLAQNQAAQAQAAQEGEGDHDHSAHVTGDGIPVYEPERLPEDVRALTDRLFKDIVCMCGDCKRLTLAACRCSYAADERNKIMAMIEGKDISTPGKRDEVYREVTRAFVDRYGGAHVLAVPLDEGFNRLAWAVPYAVFAGALILFAFLAYRWVQRGKTARAKQSEAVVAKQEERELNDPLADKLDEELDEID